jgi:hypothetical protein
LFDETTRKLHTPRLIPVSAVLLYQWVGVCTAVRVGEVVDSRLACLLVWNTYIRRVSNATTWTVSRIISATTPKFLQLYKSENRTWIQNTARILLQLLPVMDKIRHLVHG